MGSSSSRIVRQSWQVGLPQFAKTSVVGSLAAHNRYYASTLGRFTTADPSSGVRLSNPGSWNHYSYVMNDPVNYVDMGLDRKCPPNTICVDVFDFSPFLPMAGDSGSGGGGDSSTGRKQKKTTEDMAREQQERTFNNAVTSALNRLPESKCASIFHLPDEATAYTLLVDLVRGARGSIDYGDLKAATLKDGKWTGESARTLGVLPYSDGRFAGAAVTLNSNPEGTFFKPHGYLGLGIPENQTLTVIHELGHAANRIFGNGSSDIEEDDDPQINYNNSKLVKDKCF